MIGGRLVGAFVYNLMPEYRTHLLGKLFDGEPQSGIDRLVYRALLRRVMAEYYHPSTATSRREELKNLSMGRESGVRWAEYYLRMGFPTKDTVHQPMFRMLEECLSEGQVKKVHQVASCSGREVVYFARRYPEVTFVGSDMDDAVVSACRERWKELPNLSFTVVRLDRLDAREQDSLRSDLVYASGGLQFLDEPSLRRFLRVLLPLTRRILLTQPLAIDFLMQKHTHSTSRGNFSWNHPYTKYLAEEGWVNVHHEVGFIEEHFWAKNANISASSGLASDIAG